MGRKNIWFTIIGLVIAGILLISCSQPQSPAVQPTVVTGTSVPLKTTAPTSTSATTINIKPTATASSSTGAPSSSQPQGALNIGLSTFSAEIFYVDQGPAASEPVQGVYEYLLTMDSSQNYLPQLADKWEMSPDAKTWTFHLHKGIQFQDGYGEFTANDVKFSYEQATRPGATNPQAAAWALSLNNISIPDTYTVVFNFKTPYITLGNEAGAVPGTFTIVSQQYVTQVGADRASRRPVGTGPFEFVDILSGDHITLAAIPNHWRQTPQFKNVIYRDVPDEATMTVLLKTRQIDISSVSAGRVEELKAANCAIVGNKDSNALYGWFGGQFPSNKNFDPTVPWVGNPSDPASTANALKVRQALSLGVDRQSILTNILKGYGTLYAAPLFTANQPWTDPAWKPVPYDPTQAKTLLAQAGYPNGLTFDFVTFPSSSFVEAVDVTQAVAMQWQKIGVTANVKVMDLGSIRPLMTGRTLVKVLGTQGVPRNAVEPYPIYNTYFYTKAPQYRGVEDPRLDNMENQILAEPDATKRAALERQYGQLLIDNWWIITICHKDLLFAVGPRVSSWQPMSITNFFRNPEYAKRAQ